MDKAVILARGLGTRMRRQEEGVELSAEQQAAANSGQKAMIRFGRPFLDYVLADLAEAHRDIDPTPHGDGKSERIRERIEAKVDEHRRALRWAIADMLGVRRTTVELI